MMNRGYRLAAVKTGLLVLVLTMWNGDLQGSPNDPLFFTERPVLLTDTVFPPHVQHGLWTDGRRIIVGEAKPDGIRNMGLLTWSGDTVLPCRYWDISAAADRFVVCAYDGTCGVTDENGAWVVPPGDGRMYPKGNVWVRRASMYREAVYDQNGKKLLDNIEYREVEPYYTFSLNTFPDNGAERYFLARTRQTDSWGLFRDDGAVVLPMRFESIVYATDRHLLAASTGRGFVLYDFNGKQVLPDQFYPLGHTPDPGVLYGKKAGGNTWGFIYPAEPEKNTFVYEGIWYGAYGPCFVVRESGADYLHGPDGRRLNPDPLPAIDQPRNWHRLFWKQRNLPGELVAINKTSDEPGSTWYGFDEKGNRHTFQVPEGGWGAFMKSELTVEELKEGE
jgi:hypothetical protein